MPATSWDRIVPNARPWTRLTTKWAGVKRSASRSDTSPSFWASLVGGLARRITDAGQPTRRDTAGSRFPPQSLSACRDPSAMSDAVFQRCIHPDCAATYAVDDTAFQCTRCGGLLDVAYDWDRLNPPR